MLISYTLEFSLRINMVKILLVVNSVVVMMVVIGTKGYLKENCMDYPMGS